jgi:hypothetical protein
MTDERIGDYGQVIGSPTVIETKVLFNTAVTYGSEYGLIAQAMAGDPVIGFVEFDYRRWYKDNTVRDGWEAGEAAPVKNFGEAIVTVSGPIDYKANVTLDDNGQIKTAGAQDKVLGIALEEATTAGQRIIVFIQGLS